MWSPFEGCDEDNVLKEHTNIRWVADRNSASEYGTIYGGRRPFNVRNQIMPVFLRAAIPKTGYHRQKFATG